MKSTRIYYLLCVSFFIILVFQSKAQDYYIYGKTQPILKSLPEIADYYQVDVLMLIQSESLTGKYWAFQDTLYDITREYLSWDLEDKMELNFEKVRRMFSYKYIHLFPIEKGDTLILPCGRINPLNRHENFEEFDKLFTEISLPQDFIFSKESAFDSLNKITTWEEVNYIPNELSTCICDSIGYESLGGIAYFKFKLNTQVTAYFVMKEFAYPFSGYLYLFRNTDKKLYLEKGILAYAHYEPSSGPSQLATNTQIKDYDKDGDLDILIYKNNLHYSEPISRIEKSLKVLLWDEKNNDFIEREEYSSQETTKYFLGDNYSRKTVYLQKTTYSHPKAIYSEEEILKILGNIPE